ncbi:beta-ketoacyl-[acyl-carrier-protein] synthase family protein [Streptococcus gordonii]|uniref:beta-ketoacyl-[acyl-carrier-protein] synthase family protein n=1 Tax=Streptococcus gordonii TaxID=1302 RepID=UPI000779C5BE|nr:beta-ketoacyl-[acyl-carrier-protein] synthase family protein [Streptococcus gordonii]VTT23660.1 3-oxoacyl-ACP synthase [Streptococcus gordonii]
MSRVVVTGIGVVSALGNSVEQWWKNLLEGKSTIHYSNVFNDLEFSTLPVLSEIEEFNFEKLYPELKEYIPLLDKGMKFGLAAANQAFTESIGSSKGIVKNDSELGVFVGTTTGGISSAYNSAKEYVTSGRVTDKNLIYKFPPSSWPAIIAHRVKAKGKIQVLGTSCYAGGESIGVAYREIKAGHLKAALAGGLDAPIVLTNYLSFKNIGAAINYTGSQPETACRPFSYDRNGMVLGEGGAFLVLEELENARARGAKIYAELVGYSVSSDGENMVHPSERGHRWSDAINDALAEAKINGNNIDFVSCHGTGTKLNDRAEMRAIHKSINKDVRIGSIKSMIGHTFGGASAIEVVQLVKTLQTGWIPPTINFRGFSTDEGEGCIVNSEKEFHNCKYVLKTATGFGGSNLAMILKGWDNE